MASRNTKPKATKQVAIRTAQSAPARSSRNLSSQTAREVPNSASRSLNTVSSRKFPCNNCDKSFTLQTELLQHSRDKHGTKPPGSNVHNSNFRMPDNKQTNVIKCSSCTRQFSAPCKLEQHRKDKHQANQSTKVPSFQNNHQQNTLTFSCVFCPKRYSSGRDLTQHTKDKHKIDVKDLNHSVKSTSNGKSLNGVKCISCPQSFANASKLSHQRDRHKVDPPTVKCGAPRHPYNCSICSSQFETHDALLQHTKDKHLAKQLNDSIHVKRKSENHEFHLAQHIKDKHNIEQTRKPEPSQATAKVKSGKVVTQEQFALNRKKVIDEYYAKKVDIDKDEKKISVELVNDTLAKIMKHVNGQKGGDIYCPNHRKAGSFPVNTKIGKPDEFDTNICLKLEQQDVKVSRGKSIHYTYGESEHATNMNIKCELSKTGSAVKAPNSYAIASTTCDKVPGELLHGNDLVPREIRYDLYQKIRTAKDKLGELNYVDLSRNAHGPALTLTIHPPKRYKIQHDISVDITISLPCGIPIEKWPRRETKRAFSEPLIKDVKETGTHLVPKKDEFWAVSYSKAERALFSRLDEGNGCRKFVYKMLKKYMQSCKSRSPSGLRGLSSHILKTQLLWSCERHTSPEFWHHNNRDVCLVETLRDLETTLRSGHLSDYFDTSVDILKGKDNSVCLELANYLRDKKCELEQ
ncbi:zinc finger protein 423-like [Ruditapes philippinarum]|uniref:zinc finger protein 423-like n=1 Tax=Ruditapes philippinarum TaxID=129788 RepID=UPI00295B841E|nr:zinc finger protein 423-like [Ruditapes philippinarum]